MRRIAHGELLSAVSAAALLVAMFALEWFGVDGVPGRTASLAWTVDAWHGMTVVRWVMVASAGVALGAPLLHATQRSHGAKTSTSGAVLLAGVLTSALLIYRVLIDLPASGQVVDQKAGAFVGLVCALGIALGGYEALRADRAGRGAPIAHRPRRAPAR